MEILPLLTGTLHSGVAGDLCRHSQLDLRVVSQNQLSSIRGRKTAAKISFPRNLLDIGIITAHSPTPGADLHVFWMEPVSNGMNLGRYGVEEGGEGSGMSSVFGKGLYQRLAVVGGQASPRGGGDRNSIPVQQFEHIGIALKVYIQGLFTTPQGQLAESPVRRRTVSQSSGEARPIFPDRD